MKVLGSGTYLCWRSVGEGQRRSAAVGDGSGQSLVVDGVVLVRLCTRCGFGAGGGVACADVSRRTSSVVVRSVAGVAAPLWLFGVVLVVDWLVGAAVGTTAPTSLPVGVARRLSVSSFGRSGPNGLSLTGIARSSGSVRFLARVVCFGTVHSPSPAESYRRRGDRFGCRVGGLLLVWTLDGPDSGFCWRSA